MFRLYPPNQLINDPADGDLHQTTIQMIDYVVKELAGNVLPSDMVETSSSSLPSSSSSSTISFMSLDYSETIPFSSAPDGTLAEVGGGETPDRGFVVGLVYGPGSSSLWSGNNSVGLQIYNSFVQAGLNG